MKKYFKYILLTFILLLGFNLDVKADTTCFYEYQANNQKLRISVVINSNGNLSNYYMVKDLNNKKNYQENFGNTIVLENPGIISNINFSNEAKKIIADAKTCVDLGTMADSTGATGMLRITEPGKVSTESEKYLQLKPTSDSTSTPDTSDPIVESFERRVNGTDLTFGKRKSGKYYFKVSVENESNDTTFSTTNENIYLPLTKNGNNYTYAIYKDEIKELWSKGKSKTIRIFNPGENLRIISLKSDLNGYVVDSQQGTIEVVGKEDKYNGEIKYLSDICNENKTVITIMKVVGYALVIVKILVPLLLIAMGIISFSKIVINGDEGETKKAASGLLIKFIAAVVIFVLPTIINFIFETIDGATDGTEDYENCRICIFDPRDCDIP